MKTRTEIEPGRSNLKYIGWFRDVLLRREGGNRPEGWEGAGPAKSREEV